MTFIAVTVLRNWRCNRTSLFELTKPHGERLVLQHGRKSRDVTCGMDCPKLPQTRWFVFAAGKLRRANLV